MLNQDFISAEYRDFSEKKAKKSKWHGWFCRNGKTTTLSTICFTPAHGNGMVMVLANWKSLLKQAKRLGLC